MNKTNSNKLKSEQLNWLFDKEARCKESRTGGALIWPFTFYYRAASIMTEEYCIELIN